MKKFFLTLSAIFFLILLAISIYIIFTIFHSNKGFEEIAITYQMNSQIFFMVNFLLTILLIFFANMICLRQVLVGWEKTRIIAIPYLLFIFYCSMEWVVFSAAFTNLKYLYTAEKVKTPLEEFIALYFGIVVLILFTLNNAFLRARNNRVLQYLQKKGEIRKT